MRPENKQRQEETGKPGEGRGEKMGMARIGKGEGAKNGGLGERWKARRGREKVKGGKNGGEGERKKEVGARENGGERG